VSLVSNSNSTPAPLYQAALVATNDAVSGKTEVYSEKKDVTIEVDVQFYVCNEKETKFKSPKVSKSSEKTRLENHKI
jgi:hypothetical protein